MDPLVKYYDGHLLDTETYIGGRVECLETGELHIITAITQQVLTLQLGVFRNDIPCHFKLDPSAFQTLIDKIDRALTFALEVEHDVQRCDVVNYDEVKAEIVRKLEALRDTPIRKFV